MKHLEKGEEFDLIKCLAGNGILTGPGTKDNFFFNYLSLNKKSKHELELHDELSCNSFYLLAPP